MPLEAGRSGAAATAGAVASKPNGALVAFLQRAGTVAVASVHAVASAQNRGGGMFGSIPGARLFAHSEAPPHEVDGHGRQAGQSCAEDERPAGAHFPK